MPKRAFSASVLASSLICVSPLAAAGAADVIGATARRSNDGTWTFEVSMRCDDKNATYFCDRFEIMTLDKRVLGVRRLLHDHADEQPFTRALHGVRLPDAVARRVLIRGHHNVRGYDGATFELDLHARRAK